jgi:cytoskeletal protein CcmA (bactofilin family)
MFSKKEEESMDKVGTIIGKDTIFQGNIKANGTLRVDGRIEGDVDCQGDVIIGETGSVIASIKAKNILIAGAIKGNVSIAGKLELAATGKLEGDILSTNTLIVDDGAIFQGACQMTKTLVHDES